MNQPTSTGPDATSMWQPGDADGTRMWQRTAEPIIVLVGRDPSCGYVVADDDSVSRQHAQVTLMPDSVIIRDLESANGTWVNGQRLTGPAEVPLGTAVGFGGAIRYVAQSENGQTATLSTRPAASSQTAAALTAPGVTGPNTWNIAGHQFKPFVVLVAGAGAVLLAALLGVAALIAGNGGGSGPTFNNVANLEQSITEEVNAKLARAGDSGRVDQVVCVDQGSRNFVCSLTGNDDSSASMDVTVSADGSRWVSH